MDFEVRMSDISDGSGGSDGLARAAAKTRATSIGDADRPGAKSPRTAKIVCTTGSARGAAVLISKDSVMAKCVTRTLDGGPERYWTQARTRLIIAP